MNNELSTSDIEAMIKTIKLRFETHFEIYETLVLIDPSNPLCFGLKTLRAYIKESFNHIVEVC